LQGTIGGIYAREERLPEQVWKAIYYQYLPVGVEADAPPSREQLGAAAGCWAAVSLADKLDTFVSLSRAGERATGSRDPFGLRRQAQGAVRILMDLPELTGIDREVWLGPVLTRAAAHAPDTTGPWTGEAAQATLAFAIDRVRFALESRGFAGEVVRAATPPGDVSPLRARRVAEALQGMRASEDFQALAILFKRVKNIVPSTGSGQGPSTGSGQAGELRGDAPLDRDAIVEPAERALLAELELRQPRVEGAVGRSDYRAAFVDIAGLRAAVDRFFTEVFVMADDARTRNARLKLMADLRDLILQLADISEIIPQTE
jgi:glycyl-tRNA synthetase beta chain